MDCNYVSYQRVFQNFKSQLNKFWLYSKMFKSGCSVNFVENALNPNDTPILGKFLHKNTTEYSEIWRDGSYWLTECYCTVFMGKTCYLELKIEFNDFTVSLRGGWLYFHILLSVLDVGNMLTSQVNEKGVWLIHAQWQLNCAPENWRGLELWSWKKNYHLCIKREWNPQRVNFWCTQTMTMTQVTNNTPLQANVTPKIKTISKFSVLLSVNKNYLIVPYNSIPSFTQDVRWFQ